jgi:hypothetical protein
MRHDLDNSAKDTTRRCQASGVLATVALFATLSASGETQALPKHVLLHAQNWTVSVTQPDGWQVDKSPTRFPGTLFHRTTESLGGAADVISVQFLKRDNQSAQDDLAADIARYKLTWPNVRFGDFTVAASHGKAFGKMYYLTPAHTEAVVYLDPGSGTPCFFIVNLVSFDRPAPPDARAALKKIVSSLLYVSTTPT